MWQCSPKKFDIMAKVELYDSYVQVLERCIITCVTRIQLDCVYDMIERFDVLYQNNIDAGAHRNNVNKLLTEYTSMHNFLH
jgi:hypothetical protein